MILLAAVLAAAPLIFISHARVDRERAIVIHEKLRKAGCQVWRDDSIKPGVRWAYEVEAALDKSDVVLFLIGTPCNTCRSELHRALRRGKQIVPVLLRPDVDIPLLVEQFQRIEEDDVTELCK